MNKTLILTTEPMFYQLVYMNDVRIADISWKSLYQRGRPVYLTTYTKQTLLSHETKDSPEGVFI